MAKKKDKIPARVMACFDSETVNVSRIKRSLPVCYQLGVSYTPIEDIAPENITAAIYRDIEPVHRAFDTLITAGMAMGVAPVVMVHNLAYDIHFLMDYIDCKDAEGYTITCCFKSSIKPLSIKICDESGNARLIFWDTLSFSGKGLDRMGRECGFLKASGSWDYSKARNTATPLTPEEEHYALQDVRVPFIWLAWWCRLNPEVPTDRFGDSILTKTSVVRYKCKLNGNKEYYKTTKGAKQTLYRAYMFTCQQELPKTEVDYNLMVRSTSAGWTFTASRYAGVTACNARKYDATSMHPSHMVSHYYPRDFAVVNDVDAARYVFDKCIGTPLRKVLDKWQRPFEYAFNARMRFHNIRPRTGSVFARDGVLLHGEALFSDYAPQDYELEDESSALEFNAVNADGYANTAVNPVYEFGKLIRADEVTLSLNELNAWVHAQVYEWDACEVLEMSGSCRFLAPPDYMIASVALMLGRKKTVKDAMHGALPDERPEWIPADVWGDLEAGIASSLVKEFYKQVKADLNSLYGMFATNEFKQSIEYKQSEAPGVEPGDFAYDGVRGFEAMPDRPKAWYNYGLRIAAWSRVQQCVAINLVDGAGLVKSLVNGDTDSFAWEASGECADAAVLDALRPLHERIRVCIKAVCARWSRERMGVFAGLGEYMVDCEPHEYVAVANKRYAYTTVEDGAPVIHTASAGIPTASIERGIGWELEHGAPLNLATIRALGYGCCYIGELSGAKYRSAPGYSERLTASIGVKDYLGNVVEYEEGEQQGIYLDETDKALGLGQVVDMETCYRNAGYNAESDIRHYEKCGKRTERW